jgi:hypothetical protein
VKVRFSIPAQWSPEYQQQVHGQIERAFDGIREFAIPPPGGTAGQVLTKNTATDYDFAWIAPGSITANYLPRTTDVWQQSTDNRNRFYFAANARTYFGSQNGYEWRSAADAALMSLDNNGSLLIQSGTNQPLDLRTSSGSPWAIGLTRTDLGSTVRAYNASGVWTFSSPIDTQTFLYGNGKVALQTDDTWLRLNQSSHFSSGVYTPGNLRIDGLLIGNGSSEVIRTSDTYLRLNNAGAFTSGVYTPGTLTAGGPVIAGDLRSTGMYYSSDTSYYVFNTAGYSYGSWRVGGTRGGYAGVVLDIGNKPTLMSAGGSTCGVYFQTSGRWAWYDDDAFFHLTRVPFLDGNGAFPYHTGGQTSAAITVSTSAPSGGNNGDIWLKV